MTNHAAYRLVESVKSSSDVTLVTAMMVMLICAVMTLLAPVTAVNVHIVPHTHDDVGWLKTVDQYYYGANNSIQHAGVQYILDSVISALVENSNRTFIYVEQAFFQTWWAEQTPDKQNQVRTLVKNKQFEFINGGWCMHDEAAAHYVDMIDQTTLGHKFINDEFGVQPTIGWQIDPFGHSATQAALLSYGVGFDGLFFARSDFEDRLNRESRREMEVIWSASKSLGADNQIFTGAFVGGFGYGPPSGFNWDLKANTQRIQDDPRLEGYNVDYWVDLFNELVDYQAERTHGNNVMWTMGSDFQHENSEEYFKEIDKLIKYANANGTHNVNYSTPSRYVAAKNAEDLTWTTKTDDYFPYSDSAHSFWTGYFTSRPALKRYVRIGSAFLQVARQLEVFASVNGSDSMWLWKAQGIAQHHDAVSGTSKQHVAYDYARRIADGIAAADKLVEEELSIWITPKGQTPLTFTYCPLANISVCPPTQQEAFAFALVVYNPIARSRMELVRVPVNSINYEVFDPNDKPIVYDIVKVFHTIALQEDAAPYTLQFVATVPGIGYSTYFIKYINNTINDTSTTTNNVASPRISRSLLTKTDSLPLSVPSQSSLPCQNQTFHCIDNGVWELGFDNITGLLTVIRDMKSTDYRVFNQTFFYYQSYQGTTQRSGAYIFRPASNASVDEAVIMADRVDVSFFDNNATVEIRQIFTPWLTQTIRLVKGHAHIEFEYTVGHIPIDDGQGKEIITRFYVGDLHNNQTWFTDSNGREFLERKFNYRPTWNLTVFEPIAGNYYPANIGAFIKDDESMMAVLNDRSQGVTSLHEGELEFMIHRRLLEDDRRGVGEPLNETDGITGADGMRIGEGLIITGSHYVFLGQPDTLPSIVRPFATRIFQPLHATFTPITSIDDYMTQHLLTGTRLKVELPANVDLITLQRFGSAPDDDNILIRLAHQFGVDEGAEFNKSVKIDLMSIFVNTVSKIVPLSLSANQPATNHQYYQWKTTEEGAAKKANWKTYAPQDFSLQPQADSYNITLNPLEILTFAMEL